MKKYKSLIFSLIFLLSLALNIAAQNNQHNFEISKNLDIYATLLKELDKNYAEEINPGDLTEQAIESMLETLDPYTVYIPESRTEDYKLLTTGQYGGIGALIHRDGDYVVISEPYEGFPAQQSGLIAGDKILEINGKSAKGKSSSDVSDILKGQPGVQIDLLIERIYQDEPVKVAIVREKIRIPNIPYYGMVGGNVAYIKLVNFTQNAGNEVKKALLELKKDNELAGVIIDLRGNGGGLLNEAVNIVNLFVDKGQLIVSTKGKLASKNHDHRTRYAPIDKEIPVAVLVDKGSASASEIVAGAVQDLDRGVIIGQKTYGKGLVQNVIPLSYNSQVKITVAKYYIPSGRCIQAIDYFNKDENGGSHKIADSLINEFSTNNGRLVFDGGGIEPDVKTDGFKISNITRALLTKFHIFNYANEFAATHDSIPPSDQFEITEDIFNDFTAYLDDKDYDYKTKSEEYLENLKESAIKENYFDAIQADYEALQEKMMHDKNADLVKSQDEIKMILKEEIVSRYYYQKGRIIASMKDDPEIHKAIEILEGRSSYLAILDGTYDDDQNN